MQGQIARLHWEAACAEKCSTDLQAIRASEVLIIESQRAKVSRLEKENATLEREIQGIKADLNAQCKQFEGDINDVNSTLVEEQRAMVEEMRKVDDQIMQLSREIDRAVYEQ